MMLRQASGRMGGTMEALGDHEHQLQLLIDSISDYAIFFLEPDGRVASWNTGAQRIKGYTARQILGVHFSVFYPIEDVSDGKPDRELQVALRDGRFEENGWRVRKDGTRFLANVIITPMYDDGQQLRGFSRVTRDLTKQLQMEDAAQKLALVEQQERIALDANDGAISGMFAIGMSLQSLTTSVDDKFVREHLDGAVADLDEVIRALRNHIFRS